jgi:hypothetical protein
VRTHKLNHYNITDADSNKIQYIPSAIKSLTQDSAQRIGRVRLTIVAVKKTMSIKCSVCVCVFLPWLPGMQMTFFLRRIIVPSVAFQPLPNFSALPHKRPDFQGQKK